MMLRVFLAACLLVAVSADKCCSHEDRREVEYLWEHIFESSFTEQKVTIAKAVFEESVIFLFFVVIFVVQKIGLAISKGTRVGGTLHWRLSKCSWTQLDIDDISVFVSVDMG